MDRRVRYHPAFSSDVLDAAEWYSQRSSGLGDAFVRKVSEATDRVLANPEQYARSEFEIRVARIERFPYVVLFDLRPNELLILGVLHTAMSSRHWVDRKRDIGK